MRNIGLLFLLSATGLAPLAAQSSSPITVDNILTSADQLLAATLLPTRTAELRDAGVPDTTVRRIFDLFHRNQIDPVQADGILVSTRDAAREHGPTDNFGAFVQTQLAAGKRGRELSDAIRAEHQKHGRGGHGRRADGENAARGPDRDKAQGEGRDKVQHDGRDSTHDQPQGQGRSGRGRRPN